MEWRDWATLGGLALGAIALARTGALAPAPAQRSPNPSAPPAQGGSAVAAPVTAQQPAPRSTVDLFVALTNTVQNLGQQMTELIERLRAAGVVS